MQVRAIFFLCVYTIMKVKLICDWNDKMRGNILDLPDKLGLELINRDIALNMEKGLVFVVDEEYWTNKDKIWNRLRGNN